MQMMNIEQHRELAHNIIVVHQTFIHEIVSDNKNYKQQLRDYLKAYDEIEKTAAI